MKIHILGGSGSGKSTLAAEIAARFAIPHYDLDLIGLLKKGPVTEEDAFAIATEPAWVSEGIYLIWTEPLLYQADYIVLLEISWPVAVWRMVSRHIIKSISGTNRYPGIRSLYLLLKGNRSYHLDESYCGPDLVERMHSYLEGQRERTDPPTLESVRQDVARYLSLSIPPTINFTHRCLEKYREKVVLVRNNADRARLLELLAKRIDEDSSPGGMDDLRAKL